MRKLGPLLLSLGMSVTAFGQDLPNPEKASHMWDAEFSAVLGFPPVFGVIATGGWSHLIKVIRFDRSQLLTRQLDRYSYSFIRPNLRVVSSILTNLIQPRIDLYPLSFFGMTVGHTFTSRQSIGGKIFEKWTGYDCDEVSCNGIIRSSFAEMKFKYGYGRYFGSFLVQKNWFEVDKRKSQPSFEPDSGLLIENVDRSYQTSLINGFGIDGDSSLSLKIRNFNSTAKERSRWTESLIYQRSLSDEWLGAAELGFDHRNDSYKQIFVGIKIVYTLADGPEPERYVRPLPPKATSNSPQ